MAHRLTRREFVVGVIGAIATLLPTQARAADDASATYGRIVYGGVPSAEPVSRWRLWFPWMP